MGNVPLAAMLWPKQVPLAGVISFLGADLVAATVVWVHAKCNGWRYTAYPSVLLYACGVEAGITVHHLFALLGAIPEQRPKQRETVRLAVDHMLTLDFAFLVLAGWLLGK